MRLRLSSSACLLVGVLLLLAACGSPEFPTSTPVPARDSMPTPVLPSATAVPLEESPAPDPNKPKGFFGLSDLVSAYAVADSNDKTFTPFELKGLSVEQSRFPRIQPALFDREGNLLITFGADAKATLIAGFAFGPAFVSSSATAALKLPRSFLTEARDRIFPPEYGPLSEQERIDFLLDALVAKEREQPNDPDIGYEELSKRIWTGLFPPDGRIPLEVQTYALEVEYITNVLPRGMILDFGFRPDGTIDFERVEQSIAKNGKLGLEIFKRKPNPDHPFPEVIPLEIQPLEKLSERDRIIFSGYSRESDKQTLKRGSVSAIYEEASAIGINAVVVPGDSGAQVFALQCGSPLLVGMLIGSRQRESKETQATVLAMERILKFIEENTGFSMPTKEGERSCPEPEPELRDRLPAAFSDGRYDFTFDPCFLNENCLSNDMDLWSPIFQTVLISTEDPTDISVVESGRAIILGGYVAVISPTVPVAEVSGDIDFQYEHRVLIGETTGSDGTDTSRYEYLAFIGWDSSKSVALFQRPEGVANAHGSTQIPFSVGRSDELKLGHALYSAGAFDFAPFESSPFPILRFASDPAHISGFAPGRSDRFYFQGSGRSQDIGGPLCALRDGTCEVVGFAYTYFDKPREETLSTALTVEFVLDAVKEIACENQVSSLCGERAQNSAVVRAIDTPQTLQDRRDIDILAKDIRPSPSLLLDMHDPDFGAMTRREARIAVWTVADTGGVTESSGVVYRDAFILSEKYVLTASLLPDFWTLSGEELVLDTSDVTSNTVFSDDNASLEARIALLHKFVPESDILQILEDGVSTPDVEILQVVLVRRGEYGYALLERPPLALDPDLFVALPQIAFMEDQAQTNQDIFISFSKNILIRDGTLDRIPLISRGVIIHSEDDSPELLINGFVPEETVGSGIYANCGEKICVAGIVSQTSSNPAIIQTEGLGLSINFILEEIKEKTGIDLSP